MAHIIDRVAKKIARKERLSEIDALDLFHSPELFALGELADEANRAKNQDVVFYNINRHINPTNICALSCKFCAYSRKPGEEGGYAYSIEEMVAKAGEAVQSGATEVHMVGGLHPRWKYEHYRDMIAAIKKAFPALHLKAFTAVELDWLSRKARKPLEEVLDELQSVGLGSLPGGGAEIFHPEIRDVICDTKVSAEQWLNTHALAHKKGMHSNATMLYGHIERYEHRVDHMLRLRGLQDETHGFNAFIPLSFQPHDNEMGISSYTFGYDDLKTIAIARLFLDNFRHVKAYWVMLGQDIAQLALQFGANDLDGTIVEEKISRMAGGRAGMLMTRPFLENLIRKADRSPCERDTLYRPIGKPLEKPAKTIVLPQEDPLTRLVGLAHNASLHELAKQAAIEMHYPKRDATAAIAPALSFGLSSILDPETLNQEIDQALRNCQEEYHLIPHLITLDAAAPQELAKKSAPENQRPKEELLIEGLKLFKAKLPNATLSVAGIKSLWTLAQDLGTNLSDLLSELISAGTDLIESSAFESESDLTHSEGVALHHEIHQTGLASIAKVELTAPASWQAPRDASITERAETLTIPMWDSFVRRVLAFGDLQKKTGKILGLSVEVSPGSFVTPTEYLKAVAIARMAAPNIPVLITPLARIPSLSPGRSTASSLKEHPGEKFAAIALHCGASDLGAIDPRILNPITILQQIRAAGFQPRLRGLPLAAMTKNESFMQEIGMIRHQPSLASAL